MESWRSRTRNPGPDPLPPEESPLGTCLHGLFHNHDFRRTLLLHLAAAKGIALPAGAVLDMEKEYDRLADLVSRHLDMDAVHRIAGLSH